MPTLRRVVRLLLASGLTLACGQQPTSLPSSAQATPTPPPSAGAGFVYAPSAAAVHAFDVDRETGALSPLSGSPFPGGSPEEAGPLLFVPSTRMLFGARYQAPVYRADLRTGALTLLGQVQAREGLGLDATGRHLYAVGGSFIGPGGIDFIPYPGKTWAYAVDPGTGGLSQLSGSPYDGGYYPVGATVTQAGRLLLVCNQGYSGHYYISEGIPSLSVYARNDTTGVLASVPGSPFDVACFGERWLAVTPSGRALFSAGRSLPAGEGRIEGYRLGTDGRPLPASQLAYGAGSVESLALDPSGRWLFASLGYGQQTLLVLAVDDEAGLAQRQQIAVDGPAGRLQVDPSGRFLLEWRGGHLHVWVLDRDRGILQAALGSPLQDEGGPALALVGSVAFDPSGRHGYVATRQADGTFRILPFLLDAAARSVTPLRDGARSLPAEPAGLTFVPAEP